MLWEFKPPVWIEEKDGQGFRWICYGTGACKKDERRRLRRGPWKNQRRYAELGGSDHYQVVHR